MTASAIDSDLIFSQAGFGLLVQTTSGPQRSARPGKQFPDNFPGNLPYHAICPKCRNNVIAED